MPHDTTWTRASALADLHSTGHFDVVVIGGGVIGAATALDAASRGLSVALVERRDFAAATSSRSTKMLHGGIRYLPHFEFALVREGLLEQKILAETADFLYKPLEFAIPLYPDRGLADLPAWASVPALMPLALRLGLGLYDALGTRKGRSHRRLDVDEMNEIVTTLRQDDLKGGFIYRDALTDDARMTITVAKTAVLRHGAVAVNGVDATEIIPTDDGYRVAIRDLRDGSEGEITGSAVVAATWASPPPAVTEEGGAADSVPIHLSKGAHLVLDPDDVGIGDTALVLPETDDGRVLFIVPWRGTALLGTTDTPYEGSPDEAVTTEEDVEYLMRHLRMYLDVGDIEPISWFAGVRALAGSTDGSTAKASRAHSIESLAPGYIQVVGGKLTAFRAIAADAADAAARHLGTRTRSTTRNQPIIGAGIDDAYRRAITERAAGLGIDEAGVGGFIERYGTETSAIFDMIDEHPHLGADLPGGSITLAEVRYMARYEAAASVADVALRRSHVAWFTSDHGRDAAPHIAGALANELGWDDARIAKELADFETALAAEAL